MLDFDWFFRAKDRRDLYVSDILRPQPQDDLVRLGNNKDGGYVITRRMLANADFLVSLGVGYEYSFEIDFARAVSKREGSPDCLIHAYDDSVFEDSELKVLLKKSRFKRFFRYIHDRDYEALTINKEFFSGQPAKHIKKRAVARDAAAGESSVEEICQHADVAGALKGLMFKIDIEGAEYDILTELLVRPEAQRIKGLICEFHDVNQRHDDFTKVVKNLKNSFHIVHIHVNNCSSGDAIELSFERKYLGRRVASSNHDARLYPLPALDFPNNPRLLDFALSFRSHDYFKGEGIVIGKDR